MWEGYWLIQNFCLILAIPFGIISLGILLTWWKGEQGRIRILGLGITFCGSVVLLFLTLLPFVLRNYLVSGTCLVLIYPLLMFSILGFVVVILYEKRRRAGMEHSAIKGTQLSWGIIFLGIFLISIMVIVFMPRSSETFSYRVDIVPGVDGEYTVFIPAPIEKDGGFSNLAYEVRVLGGNGTVSLVGTENGRALEVRGRGPVSIGVSARHEYIDGAEMQYGDISLSLLTNDSALGRRDRYGSGTYNMSLNPISEASNITLGLTLQSGYESLLNGRWSKGTVTVSIDRGWHPVYLRVKTSMAG